MAVNYPHVYLLSFGGLGAPALSPPDGSRAAIWPVPLDRTTSYVPGTRTGPREILLASNQMDLWDEETETNVDQIGLWTLPEMEFPFDSLEESLARVSDTARELMDTGMFLVTLGGEHGITPALVAAAVRRWPDLTVLQIDAHADLRDSYLGNRLSHACAMRRTLECAPLVQVGIRSISAAEAQEVPDLPTKIFYDWNMRQDPQWVDRVVDNLSPNVYLTVDLDGLDPACMPAVGTSEPGGLSWTELTRLLRAVFEQRTVVAADCVELCPIPGVTFPNYLAAKLVQKMLAYRFAGQVPPNGGA